MDGHAIDADVSEYPGRVKAAHATITLMSTFGGTASVFESVSVSLEPPIGARILRVQTIVLKTVPLRSAETWRFPKHFDEGGFSKNRRLRNHRIAIAQVPSSRILTVCGEVAERLKAAVC